MNPEPLIRIFADHAFEHGMDPLGVLLDVSGHRDLGIKAEDIALLRFGPESESRHHWRIAVVCELYESCAGARFHAEEIYEDAFRKADVLVDQNAYGFSCA